MFFFLFVTLRAFCEVINLIALPTATEVESGTFKAKVEPLLTQVTVDYDQTASRTESTNLDSRPDTIEATRMGDARKAYRATSLTRERIPQGPCRRPMPRVLWGS